MKKFILAIVACCGLLSSAMVVNAAGWTTENDCFLCRMIGDLDACERCWAGGGDEFR